MEIAAGWRDRAGEKRCCAMQHAVIRLVN